MLTSKKNILSEYISSLFSNKFLPLALLATSSSLVSYQSIAQENQADEVERIIVTGSRRNDRTISESNVPVDVINGDDLASTGQLEISQVLSTLIPSFNYPHATIADGTDHARPAVLRGLAPDHTLVLINGKRRHSSALLNLNGTVGRGSTAVDLNAIPTSAIKSIEILRDGAAAQYGSDAIAGVINIILKDQEGGSLNATYGRYETQMAGVPQLTDVTINDSNKLVFITGADRKRSDGGTTTISGDWGTQLSEKGFINLSFETTNRNGTQRSGFDPREQYDRINGNLDPREFTFDRYNHKFGKADINSLATFYNFGYDLNDNTQLYSFGSYSKREGSSAGFYRRAKDSRNVLSIYPNGFLPHISTDVKDQSAVLGVKGETNEWNWDASATYGKNKFDFGVKNSLNTSLGAQSPTEFNNGALIYQQKLVNLNANTVFNWGLPDDVFFATGLEYRSENYQITAGEQTSYLTKLNTDGTPVGPGGAQVLSGFAPSSAVDQSRHNFALYVEFDTNLTESFNLTYAGRYEDYSDFGSKFINKLAGRYEVNDELAFRGAISTGFRAPSLAQQSYKSIATVFTDGVPNEVGIFPVADAAAQALGAKALTPEESINTTLGFVYQLDNFNLTVDAYRITIDDRIVLSENLTGPAVVEILKAAGELNTQRARYFTNAINTTTKGIDIVTTYDLEFKDYGNLQLSAGINFNDTEVTHVKVNPSELSSLGDSYVLFSDREITRFEVGTPKNKFNLAATWNIEDVTIQLKSTRYGKVIDASSDPQKHEVLESKWITDLDVSYQVTDNLKLSVGANNLFDQYPQDTFSNIEQVNSKIDPGATQGTFNQIFPYSGFSAYSIDGRFVYGRVSYTF